MHIWKGITGQVIGLGEYGPYVKTKDSMIELTEYECEGRKIRIGERLK